MNVSIEIKDVAGTLATIDNVPYDLVTDMYKQIDSEKVIVWQFNNRDIILNMRNIVNIIVKKE